MDSPITPQLKQLIDSLPGFVTCKNLQSTHLCTNQQAADLIGLRNKEEAFGMTDLDIPCGAVESAHLFRAQDREVIRTGQPLRVMDIHRYAGNKWRTLFAYKTPLRDPEQKIIGTICQSQEIDSRWLLELGVLLGTIACRPMDDVTGLLTTPTSYTIGRPGRGPKLSQRQEEVLFLLLRGKSARMIGKTLSIATRTVEWHQLMLKEKFGAASKSELIDKAIEQGYLHNIPPGLCKRSLSIILRED